MNISELPLGGARHLDLRLEHGSDPAQVHAGAEAELHADGASGQVVVRIGTSAWSARPAVPGDEHVLDDALRMDGRMCWVPAPGRVGPGTLLGLFVRAFPLHVAIPFTLEIGVDEHVCRAVAGRAGRREMEPSRAMEWLAGQLVLPPFAEGRPARMVVAGPRHGQADPSAFRVLGVRVSADVERTEGERFTVRRVTGPLRPDRAQARLLAVLAAPEIRFSDATAAGLVRAAAFDPLWQQVRAAGSYLDIWEAYHRLEAEAVERRARAIGTLAYRSRAGLPDGSWLFHLRESPGADEQAARLAEAGDVDLAATARPGAADPAALRSPRRRGFRGRCASVDPLALTVRLSSDGHGPHPPEAGYLEPALTGDRVRIKRRLDAHTRLLSATAEMPQLAPLLEGLPVPTRRRREEDPLSPAALAALGGRPTPRQTDALRVALNTPDIALIQGPPGTGKTRVIAALQARLGEITGSAQGLAGQILLTSFQHEAVENAAAATQVFGLPAVKVDTADRTDAFDVLEKWRRERVDALSAALAGRPASSSRVALIEARALHEGYHGAPAGLAGAQRLLRNLLDLGRGRMTGGLEDRVDELERRITRQLDGSLSEGGRRRIARAVRALRTTPSAFEDDGPQRAACVLGALDAPGAEGWLDDAGRGALHVASARATGANTPPAALLARLEAIRGTLLDRVAASADERRLNAVHDEVDRVAAEVVDAIRGTVERSRDGVEGVLAEHLHDLQSDPAGVREALREYTAVLAATCQQSVSMVMLDARRAGGHDDVVFDTVLVDEAARANPLDLFIPLTRARRRIVLVGDHRQLPHVLDAEVEHELERRRAGSGADEPRGGDAADVARLRISLFEHLFRVLREREKEDGICRTVTLDTQFRMHPVLGEFVSRVFYEPYCEGFGSHGDADRFAYEVPGYGAAVAAFVHVPRAAGGEGGGRSKTRPAEARWLAGEVHRLLRECPTLSVGVISFYRAQADLVLAELARAGIAEKQAGADGYRVRPEWKSLHDARGRVVDRLRVGTVDAFQGREFDVVFLSMTRSRPAVAVGARELRRKFGHLMLENRLCVAMSRQRRLLVVAGDEEMVLGPDASGAVPGLVRFHELCRGPHGARTAVG